MMDLRLIRVGCAGWNIPRTVAVHFPAGSSHLVRYSQVLNCCEINSSFYRPHRIKTWLRWAASVPDDFQFAVKVPRAITHEPKLACSSEILLQFLNQIRYLENKLGPVLVQLPPSVPFKREQVIAFLSLLRQHHRGDIVCEPRHSSWFGDEAERMLQDFEIARVAADPACVPDASLPGGSTTIAYFRLHGSPRMYYSPYTKQFLNAISTQLETLATRSRVWCVFDNTASGAATSNAIDLKAKLAHGTAEGSCRRN